MSVPAEPPDSIAPVAGENAIQSMIVKKVPEGFEARCYKFGSLDLVWAALYDDNGIFICQTEP